MQASVAIHGQLSPVLVVAIDEGPGERAHVLVDGYERVAALRAIATDLVNAIVVDAPIADALVMSQRLDESGHRSALEEGWLLDLLVREHGATQSDLATRLGRSTSWVSRRLSLVQALPASVHRSVRDGRLPAHAAEKYFVPLARAKRSSCETIVAGLGPDRLSDRDVQRIYDAWRAATPAEREQIEASPRLFLRVDSRRDAVSAGETERLVKDLDAISAVARRAHERGLVGVVDTTRPSVRRALGESRRAIATLFTSLEGEMPDARTRHPHCDSRDAK